MQEDLKHAPIWNPMFNPSNPVQTQNISKHTKIQEQTSALVHHFIFLLSVLLEKFALIMFSNEKKAEDQIIGLVEAEIKIM